MNREEHEGVDMLWLRWEQAQLTWQDVVRHEFTEEHWNHLDMAVLTTLGAMDRLAPILVQARQECFCDRLPKVGRNRYRVARATLVVLAQPRMLVRRRPVLVVP